jgi:hypothetical protein
MSYLRYFLTCFWYSQFTLRVRLCWSYVSDKSGDKSEMPCFSNGNSLLSPLFFYRHFVVCMFKNIHIQKLFCYCIYRCFLNASTKKTGSYGESKESRKPENGRGKLTLSMHILRHRHNNSK